jgi:hypothetical protein
MDEKKKKYIQWFCGFYEGEGWITNDVTNNNRYRIGLAQNDITPLELAKEIWGGNIRKRIRITDVTKKHASVMNLFYPIINPRISSKI